MANNTELSPLFALLEENNRIQQENLDKITQVLAKITAILERTEGKDIDIQALSNQMSTNMFQQLTH